MKFEAGTYWIGDPCYAVKDENEVLKWDCVIREFPSHNADTDLKTAYKNSTVWFHREMSRRVGIDKYRK